MEPHLEKYLRASLEYLSLYQYHMADFGLRLRALFVIILSAKHT